MTDVAKASENLGSANVRVNHEISFPEVAAIASMMGVPSTRLRVGVQVGTVVVGIMTAPTPLAAVLQAIQFVSGVDWLWAFFGEALMSLSSLF